MTTLSLDELAGITGGQETQPTPPNPRNQLVRICASGDRVYETLSGRLAVINQETRTVEPIKAGITPEQFCN
jgi:hypothetical protein